MKILILQDYLRSGGTERQSILLTRAFRAAGHDAQLVTFRPGGKLWAGAADLAPRALQKRDWHWDWYAPGLKGAVRAENPDVVMAMGRMANCHLWRVAGPAGMKRVATFRTGKRIPRWYRKSLAQADAVVTNSEEAGATVVKQYGLPPEKVTTLYNALVFKPAPPVAVKRRAAMIFLCVAMFRPEKNQLQLIETLAQLPRDSKWELWLAGDGPTWAACERRTAKLGLRGRVKFLGFQKDPSALYAAADVAVHASRSEALSNFLIEAQAAGLPAIAYDAQGIAECFIPGETGWVIPPGEADAFRTAAQLLMALPVAEREALSARAAAFARERFDPARQTEGYLQLFASLSQR